MAKKLTKAAVEGIDEDDITRRAFAAWFRGGSNMQPANTSGYREHKKKGYVVLESGSDVLAVYRVRNDGILKRLKRWPAELETM